MAWQQQSSRPPPPPPPPPPIGALVNRDWDDMVDDTDWDLLYGNDMAMGEAGQDQVGSVSSTDGRGRQLNLDQ